MTKANKSDNKLFGDDGSAQFAALTGMGVFNAFTSRRVFEESSVEVNKDEAKKWLKKAADQGNEQAKETLTVIDMF